MRQKLWASQEQTAQVQVVSGFVCVWAALPRDATREPHLAPWIEHLLDHPEVAQSPDRLNMVLFALMGFVAADAEHFVRLMHVERTRIGGHELRALSVVAAPGPSEASLGYGRNFTSWEQVTRGIGAVVQRVAG